MSLAVIAAIWWLFQWDYIGPLTTIFVGISAAFWTLWQNFWFL